MNWKTNLTTSLLTALLLPSCVWRDWAYEYDLNASALRDPPTVTLAEGVTYQFKEGQLKGRGQKFHSDYSYRRAIIIGK
jgi:endo-1,4-beta-D-glucanase Y